MFKYSERPNTKAARIYSDDVTEDVKIRRLTEIIDLQNKLSEISNNKDIGKIFEVLVEGESKRSADYLYGRNQQNKVVIFPKHNYKAGDYVNVKINECSSDTLKGEII
jgi:tRNA-2-methylthio-N6-dimethylallyladenosine synthase